MSESGYRDPYCTNGSGGRRSLQPGGTHAGPRLDGARRLRVPSVPMYTGYYFSGLSIYGPRGNTGFWISDDHVCSRSGYTGFHISDDQFYGPHGYVSDGYIYGPEARLPWSEDR